MDVDQVSKLSSALVAPVIAIIATYIAWQQWRINQRKLVMDRYDRRLRVYEEVKKILSIAMREADVNAEDLLRFRASVSEADFLFGPEIPSYLDEIYQRGLVLRRRNQEYRDYTQEQPEGYDHKKVVEEKYQALKWLADQFEQAKEKFRKYLDISA